jgi:hypothetical protein
MCGFGLALGQDKDYVGFVRLCSRPQLKVVTVACVLCYSGIAIKIHANYYTNKQCSSTIHTTILLLQKDCRYFRTNTGLDSLARQSRSN